MSLCFALKLFKRVERKLTLKTKEEECELIVKWTNWISRIKIPAASARIVTMSKRTIVNENAIVMEKIRWSIRERIGYGTDQTLFLLVCFSFPCPFLFLSFFPCFFFARITLSCFLILSLFHTLKDIDAEEWTMYEKNHKKMEREEGFSSFIVLQAYCQYVE